MSNCFIKDVYGNIHEVVSVDAESQMFTLLADKGTIRYMDVLCVGKK